MWDIVCSKIICPEGLKATYNCSSALNILHLDFNNFTTLSFAPNILQKFHFLHIRRYLMNCLNWSVRESKFRACNSKVIQYQLESFLSSPTRKDFVWHQMYRMPKDHRDLQCVMLLPQNVTMTVDSSSNPNGNEPPKLCRNKPNRSALVAKILNCYPQLLSENIHILTFTCLDLIKPRINRWRK